MWGMFGLPLDLTSTDSEEDGEKMLWDSNDIVLVGDIVVVATRAKKPVMATSKNFDDLAHLRVLGEAQGERKLYLCLVTAGDSEHINPTTIVGKKHAFDYDVDKFYHDCDGVIVSDNHVRGIAKKQRGRFCEKCTEYNEDVRMLETEAYMCLACRENPWR